MIMLQLQYDNAATHLTRVSLMYEYFGWKAQSSIFSHFQSTDETSYTGWSNTYHFCDYTFNNCPKIL
jgi:hypothetical protein